MVSFGTILVSKSSLGGSGGTLGAPEWPRPEKVGSLAALGGPFWESFSTLFGTWSPQVAFFLVLFMHCCWSPFIMVFLLLSGRPQDAPRPQKSFKIVVMSSNFKVSLCCERCASEVTFGSSGGHSLISFWPPNPPLCEKKVPRSPQKGIGKTTSKKM